MRNSKFSKEWRLKSIIRYKKHDIKLSNRGPKCRRSISLYKFSKQDI